MCFGRALWCDFPWSLLITSVANTYGELFSLMPLLVIVKHVLLLFCFIRMTRTCWSNTLFWCTTTTTTSCFNWNCQWVGISKNKICLFYLHFADFFFKCCTNICIIRAVCGIFIWRSKRETTWVLRIIGQRTACQGGDWYFYRDEGHFQLWCIFVGHCVIVWTFFFFLERSIFVWTDNVVTAILRF